MPLKWMQVTTRPFNATTRMLQNQDEASETYYCIYGTVQLQLTHVLYLMRGTTGVSACREK